MTILLVKTLTFNLFENNNLVSLYVLQHFGCYRSALYIRSTYFNITIVVCEQNLAK